MLSVEEAIESFQDFEDRASSKRDTQINRIKEDRSVLAGDQWSRADKRMMKGRSRRTINITANAVNSVVNNYLGTPYEYFSGDSWTDGMLAAWLKTKTNAQAITEGLRGEVAFGLSYLVLGTDTIEDDQGEVEIPVVYTVQDITNIYFDPDSTAWDGSDALEGAIVELRSKNYVKTRYGEEFLETDGTTPQVHVSYNHNEKMMPVVTYYKVEDGACSCYTICGDKFLYEPVQIPLKRVPIIPLYGEQTWDDDEVIYQGVVRKATPIQQLTNLAFSQLGERLAVAPKPTFLSDPEAIEGYQEAYKNYCFTMNPVLLWNPKSADGKRDLAEPKRIDNTVQYGDLTGIIGSNLELMSSIIGVDSRAIFDSRTELTATEVLTSEKQFQTQIRHYFDNLAVSFKALGEMVLELFGVRGTNLTVTHGPEEALQRQVARTELITLAGIVPDPQKPAIVNGVLKANDNNKILRDTYEELNKVPAPTAMEEQMGQTIEQMKAAIEERDQKMMEMQEELEYFRKSSDEQKLNLQAQFAEMGLRHQQDLEKMAFKAELDSGLDAGKERTEIIKDQMEIQKQGIQLDTARVKAAAEQTKAITSMLPKPEVKQNEDIQ